MISKQVLKVLQKKVHASAPRDTRGRSRLRQTTLSFRKTTPQDNKNIPHDDAVLGSKGDFQTDDAAE